MIKILFVCHGNICRSTMAESVFTETVRRLGRADEFEIASAGTSREEIGNPVHPGTVRQLQAQGIPVVPHRAVQMQAADERHYDYLIGMDSANIRNMERIVGGSSPKIRKLLSFAGSSADVADPWYTGDFAATYTAIVRGTNALLAAIDGKEADGGTT